MISLSPSEVERRFSILGIPNRFAQDERRELETTTIIDDAPGVYAFPIPQDNEGLNILSLRHLCGTNPAKQPAFFDHPWYLEEGFASSNCAAGWHRLHSSIMPDTVGQPYDYASSLISRALEVPTAVEVTLMLFLHYVGTHEQLLHKKHTWCSDHASLNRFVTVGAFGRNGLFISGHPADFHSRGLGICGKLIR